jgi:hypothetical protein
MESDLSLDGVQKLQAGPLPSTYKWKLTGKYKNDFPAHIGVVFITD